jgi:phospholipase/carboxylesterase
MHKKNIVTAGKTLDPKGNVLILLHGRGGSAEDIISLADHLDVNAFTLLAPQASNHSWYPYSFLAPIFQNEPWLSSALHLLEEMVLDLKEKGITSDRVYFVGFSQGACLTLEFVCRNATKYGGVVIFTGGLIGDQLNEENYNGYFQDTPVFIATSDPDPHVPVERVHASTGILRQMGAQVTEKVYKGMGHTISQDEIAMANRLVFNKATFKSV